ncbi:hypothetical protein FPCIR_12919 [Fusarium pseudocircinatum]|uniref:Uncharacterized protein n=1 Tax=Fusarium pseudocircinatum TaxID=56676 RepID=A0A8H5KNB3_9HYPO|nr:hypothetical protein FPCIR_12919 [Fusarium pseudocircinatum]
MSVSNNNPPPPTGRQKREIDNRLLDFVEARYGENSEVTLEMVTEIIGDRDPVNDDDWDQAAEDRMIARWEVSSRKTSSDKVGTRKNNDDPLREVWRFCLRFMKQAPPIMLSPVNSLQFMPARKKDFVLSSDLFTLTACGTLAKLFIHPLWRGDYRTFVDAVKFTALCRVNARTNVSLSLWWPNHCPVIQELNARLMRADTGPGLPDTLQDLHVAARETVSGSVDSESVFSEVLFRIGQTVVAESPSQAEKAELRQGIIPFQGKDLDVIKKAIDDLALTDDRVQFSVEDVYAAFKLVGHRLELPSKLQLQSFDARACKQLPEGTLSSRIPEETEEANQPGPSRQGRDRSRSPRIQHIDRVPIRSRSRSLRPSDLNDFDRDTHRFQQRRSSSPTDRGSSSNHDNFNTSLADETHEDNAYIPEDGGYIPEASESTSRVEIPSSRVTTDLRPPLSQALATDEIGQIRREVDKLSERIRISETERDRRIEKVKTDQARTHVVFKERQVEAIRELKEDYEERLQTATSEHAKAIASLKTELRTELHRGLRAVISRCDEQADLIKNLQEENERLRGSAQAAPSQERSPTPVEDSRSDVPPVDESSQQSESLSSYLARKPEGLQLPRVQGGYTITTIPSFNGSMTERHNNILNEAGWKGYFP